MRQGYNKLRNDTPTINSNTSNLLVEYDTVFDTLSSQRIQYDTGWVYPYKLTEPTH